MYAAFSLCEFGLDDCNVHALCIDKDGGFDCQCTAGYTGNGTHCSGEMQSPCISCLDNILIYLEVISCILLC